MRAVLFVEDDGPQRELTERLYQMCAKVFHGEVVFLTAATWADGLKIMRSRAVDALILDLVLLNDVPPMDREATLKALAETTDLPPVVILTGFEGDPFLRDRCILAGADSFMTKGAANHHPEQLCEKVYDAYLRRQRDLRHAKAS